MKNDRKPAYGKLRSFPFLIFLVSQMFTGILGWRHIEMSLEGIGKILMRIKANHIGDLRDI